ncbi:hypothetical protein MMC17_004469 [Xylographa soralifera]|nr:hypothetical protein [Xylographa soralifera]
MTTSTTLERQPKRVILRLRVNDFEDCNSSEYNNAIKTYLAYAKRPTSELEENRHYAHIEPFQHYELQQTSFHIILDINKDSLAQPNMQSLPHEVYHIRRNEQGNLQLKPIQNARIEKHLLLRLREFSDTLYAWAK